MAEPPDLLFFDTFSHESSEELNLDLVQFPKPVYVSEVRIIPLGARVEGDFPGGVRLGATNPTQFQIDFFVNDLSKPGASTFETLGSLEYCQNGRIHMDCEGSSDHPRQIPTDGLVLRGWYTTITLAVYGTIAKNITEQVSTRSGNVVDVAPPPIPLSTPPASNTTQPWAELSSSEVYPASSYSQDSYDQSNYQGEYYNQDAPKDPRSYHHIEGGNGMWDSREDKERSDINRDRDVNHSREKERSRHNSVGRDGIRLRSRSIDRDHNRDHNSPRYSRSRSRDRDYSLIRSGRDDNFRRDNSRSPGYRDRDRSLSRDKDWDRSYKRDDYRRHRQTSYDRSRGGSYEKKRGSPYEKRAPSYERRPPSYENRPPSYEKRGSSYEKHMSYDKRLSPYEKRPPSYEKRIYDKRAPSYDRIRETSYDSRSRSPGREDPRKRPRTPPMELPRRPHTPIEMTAVHDRDNISPIDSVPSDDGIMEYDHNGKPHKDDIYKSYKNRGKILKGENDKLHSSKEVINYDSHQNITGILNDDQNTLNQKVNPPLDSSPTQEDAMDAEQFEPILSDEDICDDVDGPYGEMDYDINEYCGVDDVLKCFNPFRTEWLPYTPINKSPQFLYSNSENIKHVMNIRVEEMCSLSSSFQKLYEITSDLRKTEEKYTPSNFSHLSPDAKLEWVDFCEQLPLLITNIANESDILYRLFLESDNSCESIKRTRMCLLNFCQIGLDYDLALSQQQALVKIRHIKCGIRLIEALSSHKHNGTVMITLLNNINVYSKLFELYSKDYMALSIKLMILKSIDSCLGSEAAIEYFLTKRFNNIVNEDTKTKEKITVNNGSVKNMSQNGYQVLLIMLNANSLSRLKFAINALINKINFYELLKKIHEKVLQFNDSVKNGQFMPESEIEFIINALEEILCLCRNGCFELSQPKRYLPVSAQFEISKSSVNNFLIDFFKIHKLLETILYLLTCPLTYNYLVIVNPICEIITYLINNHEGLLYIVENIKVCESLFQTLMEPYTRQNEEEQMIALQDYSGCTYLQQLGLEMAYKIQALYYVNAVLDIQTSNDVNVAELFDKLHGLYCLGFGNVGKLALNNVLSMGDNIQSLLNVYEKDIHAKLIDKDDIQATKAKSPTKNYAVDLTVSTIQFSTDIVFLKKYGKRILNIAKKFDIYEQSIASNLQEVLPYLKPLEKPGVFLIDNICELVEILKGSIEHVTSAPGDLITCLRILKYLGIPEMENKKSFSEMYKTEYTELKYKYAIIQLYSLDGVSLLVSILEKMCNYFQQPSLHTANFVSIHGLHIVNIILPALELLNKMLTYVIHCRNTQFKDLTAIPIILQTYNLMHSYPMSAVGYKMAQKACRECIEILLAYTQPIAEEGSENELIHKSLWTLLCGEIIKYTLIGPYTFIPGLLIFSEILPLPLPIQTKYTLSDQELSNMISNRKLWSAHLHTLVLNITEMIQTICLSVCQPVVQLLRRVCIQLSDLASNMSLCITRAVLDLLISQLCGENNALPQTMTPVNYDVARILNFLACLATHPSVKCTILHLIKQGSSSNKSEDRYTLFIPLMCSILQLVNDTQSHVQAQECIVSIISSFYDSEITMFNQLETVSAIKAENLEDSIENMKPVISQEIYLTNAIPPKDTLILLTSASLEYISNENSLSSLLVSILRTFFLLTEHDYGFYYFKFCIDKNKQVFPNFFNKLVNGISKDSPECLSTFLELLKILQSTSDDLETTEGLQFLPRTNVLVSNDIAEMLGWYKNKENHPIIALEKFLKEVNADEELLNQVRQLSILLSSCGSQPVETNVLSIPPILGVPENLTVQFRSRCLWTQNDVQDERLGSAYWLGLGQQNEDDAVEAEMIPCDLEELTRLYLAPDTNLIAEAERLLHLPPAAPRPPTEPPLFRTKRLHVPREKRPYVSPARGRGSSQQMGNTTVVGSRVQVDAFRSRPPNTSRPPSLHVDDFLALEGCGAQPTGPTGYNKLPTITTRGGRGMRTRGITITDRGRFASATPTTSVYRRGRGTWTTVSTAGSTIVTESSPPLTSHFSLATSQHFQPPIIQHTTSTVGWAGGTNRGNRRGRGVRHGRASFLR